MNPLVAPDAGHVATHLSVNVNKVAQLRISAVMSCTSWARMWRSSGRGCTVMPSAPACRHSVAAFTTLGMPRWRVLRS